MSVNLRNPKQDLTKNKRNSPQDYATQNGPDCVSPQALGEGIGEQMKDHECLVLRFGLLLFLPTLTLSNKYKPFQRI
jgi:hypothetical protein